MGHGIRKRRVWGAVYVAAALVIAVVAGACTAGQEVDTTGDEESRPPSGRTEQAGSLAWDATALRDAAASLVGWRTSVGDHGSLVLLSDSDAPDTVWSAPGPGYGGPLAIDATEPLVVLAGEAGTPAAGGTAVDALVILRPDGTVSSHDLPAEFGSLSGATISQGRVLVLAHRATTETYDTALFALGDDGAWQPVRLEGDVPAHQFVERAVAVPQTDSLAVVLKTEGGTGDRDDEALVLARLTGDELVVYSAPFADDALPGIAPLWAEEGVVFPRTWRVVDGAPVLDIVVARWDGESWQERAVLEDADVASGVETGMAVTAGSEGVLWLRSAPSGAHGEGAQLLRLPEGAAAPESTGVDLSDVGWFAWVDAGGS